MRVLGRSAYCRQVLNQEHLCRRVLGRSGQPGRQAGNNLGKPVSRLASDSALAGEISGQHVYSDKIKIFIGQHMYSQQNLWSTLVLG